MPLFKRPSGPPLFVLDVDAPSTSILRSLVRERIRADVVTEQTEARSLWRGAGVIVLAEECIPTICQPMRLRPDDRVMIVATHVSEFTALSYEWAAGVAEHVQLPENERVVLQRAREVSPEAPRALVVGVVGTNRGIGGSTVAISLAAHAQADVGGLFTTKRRLVTTLIDSDPDGNVTELIAPPAPPPRSNWFADGQVTAPLPFLDGVERTRMTSKFNLVTRPEDFDSATPEAMAALMDTEILMRDLVVVDFARTAPDDPVAVEALKRTDVILAVVQPELARARSTQHALDSFKPFCRDIRVMPRLARMSRRDERSALETTGRLGYPVMPPVHDTMPRMVRMQREGPFVAQRLEPFPGTGGRIINGLYAELRPPAVSPEQSREAGGQSDIYLGRSQEFLGPRDNGGRDPL